MDRRTPGKTILVACDGVKSLLTADGDANQREITLEDPSGFRIGDGVAITDKRARGFTVTTATLIARTGPNTFRISRPLYVDYMVRNNATARLTFPVVGGWNVKGASVERLVIVSIGHKDTDNRFVGNPITRRSCV